MKENKNKANDIMKIAEEHGVENNYFFLKTFKNYLVQLEILDELEKTIKEDGILVTKEYVKGRKNKCLQNTVYVIKYFQPRQTDKRGKYGL